MQYAGESALQNKHLVRTAAVWSWEGRHPSNISSPVLLLLPQGLEVRISLFKVHVERGKCKYWAVLKPMIRFSAC